MIAETKPITMRDLLYVGQFPGPISGQTVMTKLLFEHLKTCALVGQTITPIDIVRGNHSSRIANAAIKMLRSFGGFFRVLLGAWRKNVYISLNSNFGMVLSLAYVIAARFGGANRMVLHHHSRDHIDRPNKVMAAIVWAAGRGAVHLCICPNMAAQLQARYRAISHTAHLSNVVGLGTGQMQHALRTGDVWRLGHMAKLNMDKGLARAIATLELLLQNGIPASLSLAGPFTTKADHDFALAAAARLGGALRLEGLISGAQKDAWFASLDLFLFPSLYRNETQGIVNLEALAAGTPIIAFGGHCIEDDLAGLNGWCLPVTADFSGHVLARIADIGRDGWPDQRRLARAQFETLHARAQSELAAFQGICMAKDLADVAEQVHSWP